jgi:hypothetical protein
MAVAGDRTVEGGWFRADRRERHQPSARFTVEITAVKPLSGHSLANIRARAL